MDDDRSLQASFWIMVLLQTMGSVDMPGKGPRKMPAPRAYMAVIVTWGILQLAADAGYGRAAKVVGWVLVLTGLVIGPFGGRLSNLFNTVANNYSNAATPTTTNQGNG